MRYALILAGGSGTRLWPMSRNDRPKQLIPFIGGRSLLQISADRLEGFIEPANLYVCAAERHRDIILRELPQIGEPQYLAEPVGRDTLNAIGLSMAVIARRDPQAVVAIFTADHLIQPVDEFRRIIASGYALAERSPETLVTFGIRPTAPATGYGYLELGEKAVNGARVVRQFREKPDEATARGFFAAGPDQYLWNSGMFVWKAATLLDCIERYEPVSHEGLVKIADAWDSPEREAVLAEIYPGLKKVSIDFAVMEPASYDPSMRVAAVPMELQWMDVGSWPSFAETCPRDADGNALAAGKCLLLETRNTLVASDDPNHLIAAVGCEDLLIIHTADATLVCRKDRAEAIKQVHRLVAERFGPEMV